MTHVATSRERAPLLRAGDDTDTPSHANARERRRALHQKERRETGGGGMLEIRIDDAGDKFAYAFCPDGRTESESASFAFDLADAFRVTYSTRSSNLETGDEFIGE